MDSFTRDGLHFGVTEYGPADGTLVLLLHGFPQTSASWGPVARRLAAAGYRVLAPDQRGYSPGARPSGRRPYRVEELAADVVALADAAGGGPVHVVGHDWGAIVAWALAALHPERVTTVTGVSVPHPAAFFRAMTRSRQALLSWYTYAFQVPGLAERYLARPGPLARRCSASGRRRSGRGATRPPSPPSAGCGRRWRAGSRGTAPSRSGSTGACRCRSRCPR